MPLRKTKNPYDFAHAVNDPALLAGRRTEVATFEYYLGYAIEGERPIHMALLGDRASGKTSLLNVFRETATTGGAMVALLDLDPEVAVDSWAFFSALIGEAFVASLGSSRWGGRSEELLQAYRLLSVGGQSGGLPGVPLTIPNQYWTIRSVGGRAAGPSVREICNDFSIIREMIGRPIVILLDEADILNEKPEILQKLRSVLNQIVGVMFVLAGTTRLFERLDDIFSPISRQFSIVRIRPFEDRAATLECIRLPLLRAGLVPERVIDPDTLNSPEIHELTRGRPYEIQLICHFMYRRVEDGREEMMTLNGSVLEDVRRQLERERDVATRPLLNIVRELPEEDLVLLSILADADGVAGLDAIWRREYLFRGSSRITEVGLRAGFERFEQIGMFELRDDLIRFRGDEFDRLYITYYVTEKGTPLSFVPRGVPTEVWWAVQCVVWFMRHGWGRLGPMYFDDRRDAITGSSLALMLSALAGLNEEEIDFSDDRALLLDLHDLQIWWRDREFVTLARMRMRVPGCDVSFLLEDLTGGAGDDFASLVATWSSVAGRMAELGGAGELEAVPLPIYNHRSIVRAVQERGTDELRQQLASRQFYQGRSLYGDDRARALFHADLCLGYGGGDLGAHERSDQGYMLLVEDRPDHASRVLRSALRAADGDDYIECLAGYNLAIALMMLGEPTDARELLERSISLAQRMSEEERAMMCLLVPKLVDGDIQFEEAMSPDLLVSSQAALDIVSREKRE